MGMQIVIDNSRPFRKESSKTAARTKNPQLKKAALLAEDIGGQHRQPKPGALRGHPLKDGGLSDLMLAYPTPKTAKAHTRRGHNGGEREKAKRGRDGPKRQTNT